MFRFPSKDCADVLNASPAKTVLAVRLRAGETKRFEWVPSKTCVFQAGEEGLFRLVGTYSHVHGRQTKTSVLAYFELHAGTKQ